MELEKENFLSFSLKVGNKKEKHAVSFYGYGWNGFGIVVD